MNVPEADKPNSFLVVRERFQNSPLYVVGIKENQWFAALGNRRVTDYYTTKEELDKILHEKDWNTLITIWTAILDITIEDLQKI